MVIRRYVRGIAFALLLLSIISIAVEALTINSKMPSGADVSDTAGATRAFSVTVNESANFTWYINGTVPWVENLTTTSTYTNNSAAIGYWNVTVIAVSVNDSSTNSTTWWWTVTAAPESNTAPNITNPNAINVTDVSAGISFSVNQSNAKTRVNYGTSEALGNWSAWTNDSLSPTITLSGLTKSTTYYYSVYAYNGSNQSYFSNSSIQSFTTLNPSAPAITNITTDTTTASSVNISFNVNQSDAKTRLYYGTSEALGNWSGWANNSPSQTIMLSSLSSGTKYYYSVYAYNGSNQSYFSNSSINNFTTKYPAPQISGSPSPSTPLETIGITSVNFSASFNQVVNVTWLINGTPVVSPLNTSVTFSYYLNNSPSTGTWNVTVVGNNTNGTASYRWIWTVRPRTYETGNRVWDANKEMNLTYTWNPMSFYAFYYDLDNNVGNESLKIILESRSDRNIQENTLQYSTAPENVSFKYKTWGSYNVIGFMAEKYFAAYTAGSTGITRTPVSPINSKQLHKILMDDDTRRAVYAGSTLTLSEGYVLKIKDVDITGGQTVLLSLLKDGGEVDTTAIRAGNTYVYSKKVGSVSELPIIAVNIETVFTGREANAAFIKGIFQISESFISINTGNRYGIMEITDASDSGIKMANKNSFSLSPASLNDVMGDIKIIVADNSSVLRFAPMVRKTGIYEVRGTISQSTDTSFDWNPLNFEGFYYDINEDVGSEKLSLKRSDRSVSAKDLVYTTTPQSVSFKYKKFGSYSVVGFMAEKYFAGYTTNSTGITSTAISTINSKQLHKVLADDDTQRAVYAGSTLTLSEGYVLKVKDVDITGGQIVLLSLLKDGGEVDTTAIRAGNTYTYSKRVGSVSNLPIIAAHIETVFAGREANAVFIKGVFQISESYTSVNQGDRYGIMEVTAVSDTSIEMKNPSSVSLSTASTVDVMGSIKFKVADSGDVRFYPFIMVNGSALAANQLAIDAPPNPMVRDTITITVTAGGKAVEGADVSFDGMSIGLTNSTGKLNYTLTRSGVHNLTATKLGYEKATKTIQVSEYVDNRLSIELHSIIDQGIPVSIKVIANGSGVSGASVTFDNSDIGVTGASGILNYTFNVGGTHNLGASKAGYVSVVREINIRLPFSEYRALDINITPNVVFTNEKVLIRSSITNAGTKADTKPVELIINGTVVENSTVSLAPGEVKEVNFTRQEALPGNYTVEILGQKGLLEVREEPLNFLLIGGIATGFGAVLIYLLTAKSKISLELLRKKLSSLGKPGEKLPEMPEEKH